MGKILKKFKDDNIKEIQMYYVIQNHRNVVA